MSRRFDRALVILNPYSGRGHGERARDELARLLRSTQTRYDIVETERPGHAIDLALAGRLAGYQLVVAAGGDGTISEVVNGLMLANEQLIERARQEALAAHLAQAAEAAEAAEAKVKAAEAAALQADALNGAAAAVETEAAEAEAAEALVVEPVAEPVAVVAVVGTLQREGEPVAQAMAEAAPAAGGLWEAPPAVEETPLALHTGNGAPPAEETSPLLAGAPPDAPPPDAPPPDAPSPDTEFVFTIPPELEFAGTLGVVPVGSGNDFASMVGIPLDMEAAVKMLERQRLRLVDVGSATVFCAPAAGAPDEPRTFQRYFDNNMGIGLEAAVIIESNKIRRLRGALLYAAAAVRALFKHRSPRMYVRWRRQDGSEGSHDKPTLLVSVGNSRRAGGGFFLTPDAEMDDKQLDVAIADDLSRPEVMALLPRALRGKHTTHPAVTMLRIETLTIQVPDGAPVQMDGEVVEEHAREVTVTVLPHKLELIA
jgi:diacylglycerol kinase family enzyme